MEVKPCDKMTFVHALVEFIILSIYELELRKWRKMQSILTMKIIGAATVTIDW